MYDEHYSGYIGSFFLIGKVARTLSKSSGINCSSHTEESNVSKDYKVDVSMADRFFLKGKRSDPLSKDAGSSLDVTRRRSSPVFLVT